MKFTSFTLLALGLSSSVLATPTRVARKVSLVERDLATMTSIISAVGDKVDALDSAIKSYNGGDPSAIEAASVAVIATTKQGAQDAAGSSDLTFLDAVNLAKPVQDLTAQVETSITDLDNKSDLIVAAGAAGTVLTGLQAQKAAAQQLATAISSKVPKDSQALAQQLAAGIADAIQKGIDHYTPLVGTGGSSTTAGPTTAAPTTTGGAGGGSSTAAAPTTSASASSGPSTSVPVIPTGSASSTPSGSAPPVGSSTGTPGNPPVSPGAAGKNHISYGLGAIAAIAAFAL